MDQLIEFIRMGGYAFYVWTAYALTFIVMAANVALPLRAIHRALRMRGTRARTKGFS